MARPLTGLVVAAGVALAAYRLRTLSTGGAVAATGLGAVAVWAGWSWASLLIGYFVASVGVSRVGAAAKAARTAAVVEKRGARDLAQVLANGGAFGAAALGLLLAPSPLWAAAGAGALAAAAADTWATEIGTLVAHPPRSIRTGRVVPIGTSGGVTVPGTAGAVAGAIIVALLAWITGWRGAVPIAALGAGVAGALADSVAGATVQERRWCDRCDQSTERPIHDCGSRTRVVAGVAGVDNDLVNLVSTLVGAAVAAAAVAVAHAHS